MKIKTAIFTIFCLFLFSVSNAYAQIESHPVIPEQIDDVVVNALINVDLYSTLDLNPVTVEIFQPSTVTVRILSPSGVGIPGRQIIIVNSGLHITQPTEVTDLTGRTTGSVYSTGVTTYTVCARDITFGYTIYIQNCKTLYVVPVAVPTFLPEPAYTKGTTNTLIWGSLGAGYSYNVEISESADFSTVLGESGWISNTSHQFTSLENGKMYFYRVKARNAYGGVSAWSSTVFSVQDSEPPKIEIVSIGDIGNNDTVEWDSNFSVQMIFKVTDNLQLSRADFLCINSQGNTYTCSTDYRLEGDNLIVNVLLRDLQRISNIYLREEYEFCVEASDAANNITRLCNIKLNIPKGEVPVTKPPIVNQIEQGLEDVTVILDNTVGQIDTEDLETITTTTSIVTTTTAIAIAIGSLWNIPYLLLQFILNLLSWLGFRAGAKPLGYVYDAITKDPIPQAVVRIFDEDGKMVWSDVTNGKGYFSARLDAGKYRITVRASKYEFPSNIIFGKDDYPLENVYHGEFIKVGDSTDLNISIPLDPLEVAEYRVVAERVWSRLKGILNIAQVVFFVVGLILAIYMYYKNPYWLTIIVLLLYIPSFFLVLRNIFAKRTKYGVVRDTEGNVVPGIAVILKEAEFDKLVAKRVTDKRGRYRILASEGRYYLQVLETGYKVESIEGDSEILVEKDEEWIINDITVSKIEKK